MNKIYQKDLFIWILENLLKYSRHLRKISTIKSSRSQVFCKMSVLKKFVKFPRTRQCWGHFLANSREIKRHQRKRFSLNFVKLLITEHLRTTAFASWSLSLKKLYIVDFHENVFELLVTNESHLIICARLASPILVSSFQCNLGFSVEPVFPVNEVFEQLSMKKDPFNQITRK